MSGQEQKILLREPAVSVSLENLTDTVRSDGTHLYRRMDPDQEAAVRFEVQISHSLPLYCYFTAPVEEQPVSLVVNGEYNGAYFDAFRWNMVNLGSFAPGDTVVIELVPGGDSFVLDSGWFYYEDREALGQAADQVKANPVTLIRDSDSRLRGSFECDSTQTLLFTIPWDSGWQLTLDGQPVCAERALNTFLSVEAAPGSHSFVLRFLPTGLTEGAVLTGLSVLMGLIWYWGHRKKKKI